VFQIPWLFGWHRGGGRTELGEDRRDVVIDGTRRHNETVGELGIGQAMSRARTSSFLALRLAPFARWRAVGWEPLASIA